MSKNNQKISINKLESVLVENTVTEILNGTDNVEIHITKTLPLQEMLLFVQEVVEACIDGETGEYLPEAYDFAIRAGVLTRYANFTLPANLDNQYMLVYNTGAFDQVVAHINERQFNDIVRAIDKKIKFMLDVISSSAVTKINEVIGKFNELAETAENAFGDVNGEDMANVVKGITQLKDINEENIAQVILKSKAGEK
ncbi:MAG: hypothetical protein IKL29_06485 [Bacteroidaceae bacterium]|nr:hypothetical protein [Bacteroidaceae bacterium]